MRGEDALGLVDRARGRPLSTQVVSGRAGKRDIFWCRGHILWLCTEEFYE